MKTFLLRYERALTAIGIAVGATAGFYVLDFQNAALMQEGMRFLQLETVFDTWVPYSPAWIWVYLTYFPMCFAPAFLIGPLDRFRRIATAFALSFGLGCLVFLTVPVRMERPGVAGEGLTRLALDWMYRIDPGFNVFPSLHVAHAVMVALFFLRYHPKIGVAFTILAALIAASTVLVKQHYVIDLPAGALLGYLSFKLPYLIWKEDEEGTSLLARIKEMLAPAEYPGASDS